MEKEKELLLLCRRLIEQVLNWGDSSIWTNDDFEQLSEKIFDKTKVQLSVSTLKRIWGKVRYENFPTAGTLNALAGFLSYDSWRDFRQQNQTIEPEAPAPTELETVRESEVYLVPAFQSPEGKRPPQNIFIAIALLAAVLVIAASIFVFIHLKRKNIEPASIKFSAIKVSDNLPNSVIFNYDASAYKSDSVFIQQTWDLNRRERVDGQGKQHTSIYYNPGFFMAKLIVDGDIIKKIPLYIKTQGWKGIIESEPIPTYLSEKDIKGNGFMGITDSVLRKKIGLPIFNKVWVNFANVHEFKDIDPGNFMLETTLRNSSTIEETVCRHMRVLVLGTTTAIIIPLADRGCVSDMDLLVGDYWISGKNHDMRGFGCDFNQFQNLRCRVQNHRLKIYLNDKLVIDTEQKRTLGEIVGIRFETEGVAQIKNVKLSTPGGGVYDDRF